LLMRRMLLKLLNEHGESEVFREVLPIHVEE
jgi:hypothetical protein